jgi:hypothetical protein
LVLLCFSSLCAACFTPIKGEKYDTKILVEFSDNVGDYSFRIPLDIHERKVSRISVRFGVKTQHGFVRADEWLRVQFAEQDGYVVGAFSLKPSQNSLSYGGAGSHPTGTGTYFPYLHVVWDTKSGFGCPIVGTSSYLAEFDV